MKIEVVVLVGLYGIWEGGVRCGGSAGSARTPARVHLCCMRCGVYSRRVQACTGRVGKGEP